MSFVKVLTDVDGVISSIPARIISTEKDGSFNINYISKTDKKHTNGKTIYEYEDEVYNITEESIDEYMYDESDCGFKVVGEGLYIKQSSNDDDEDGDYVPGSSEDDSESSDEDENSESEISDEEEDDYGGEFDD